MAEQAQSAVEQRLQRVEGLLVHLVDRLGAISPSNFAAVQSLTRPRRILCVAVRWATLPRQIPCVNGSRKSPKSVPDGSATHRPKISSTSASWT